ncbi:MAG: deoxyribose-phosphate aldolase [Thermodesulfovibrionales bacterium]
MSKSDLAKVIDYSLLKPEATLDDIKRLCEEAKRFGVYSICINPSFITIARDLLRGSDVKISSVIGFPLGMTLSQVKVYEAIEATLKGADELDIVMNIGMARSGNWDYVKGEISDIIYATKGVIHKIIIEACLLLREEKIKAAETVIEAGAEFIKTSTGFSRSGATVEDVRLLKSVAGNRCKIKAAGGIKSLQQVIEMIEAGASRIGTSHSGILENL